MTPAPPSLSPGPGSLVGSRGTQGGQQSHGSGSHYTAP